MRRIAHLSDLHFGAHDPAVVTRLEEWLAAARPDLVVVSGDLTQRARAAQFRAADALLRRIEAGGMEVVVVPGNHDVPLYDVFRRFLSPLGRYCRIIQRGRRDRYRDDEIAVLGLFSPRSLTIKDGRLNREQIAEIEAHFASLPRRVIRLLVTHHPIVPLPGHREGAVLAPLDNGAAALAAARAAHVHLLLAGHNHMAHIANEIASRSADAGILVVQAGTATSVRRRGEPNSFNLIAIEPGHLSIDVMASVDGRPFTATAAHHFTLDDAGWRRAA